MRGRDLNARVWEELTEEFRALGGVADNIRLGEGASGRGLFPIDPGRPFRLRVPENLLVSTADIMFESGVLRVGPGANAGARECKFVEDYYAHLAWGAGGRAEIERIFEQAQALPPELRPKLASEYHCGSWFDEPTPGLIETQFIESREFGYKGRDVLMPFVDLANHGDAFAYVSDGGIAIKGTAGGEITVRYAETDTYGLFRSWGFSAESTIALSVELEGTVETSRLYIERQTSAAKAGSQPWVPVLTRGDGAIKLSFLMLGSQKTPRLCRGIFRRVLRDAGFNDVDEAFDKVRRANLQHFLKLLADLETLEGAMVQSLRRMARCQLQALAFCFGVHEI